MSDDEGCNEFQFGAPAEGVVRYGNAIYLRHNATEKFLSSNGDCYSSGSGQQNVFATCDTGLESKWFVQPVPGSDEQMGYEVGFDDKFRLQHIATGAFLHSHPDIESPASGQQEVTAFGSADESDENDIWCLEAYPDFEYSEEDYLWHLGYPVVVKHCTTGRNLHSHEIEYNGNNEVSAHDAPDENDQWVADSF